MIQILVYPNNISIFALSRSGTTLGKSSSIISPLNPFGEIGTLKSFSKYIIKIVPIHGEGISHPCIQESPSVRAGEQNGE